MARNRKNQAAVIRFGPALKASFLCLIIGGSAIGYVWQKSQIDQLGNQILAREKRLNQLVADNKTLNDQLAILHSPVMLDRRTRELNLGLVPASPTQVVRLEEPPASGANNRSSRQFTQRSMNEMTP
jgi:cell division protein FtsB